MNAPDHSIRAHAYLSCSSSDRWLNCTVAPSLEAKFSDEGSSFASEGTEAHELGERALVTGKNTDEISGKYPVEMREYIQQYVDYVRDLAEGADHLIIEERLDIGAWVPECFGTSDAIVIAKDTIHVIDLKYGKGIKVFPERNTQLMLYALGTFDAFDAIYGPIDTIVTHIVQPRLDHVSSWSISAAELLAWGESIKPIARMAFAGEGTAKPGDHCQFCKARHTCRARFEMNLNLAKEDFGDMPKGAELTDTELAEIYPQLDGFVRWANDLQSYCLGRAEAGEKLEGLKLVEGRSIRKIKDELAAVTLLRDTGLDDYEFMSMKLKGITELEKTLGKQRFAEVLGELIVKPAGKPVLVTKDDPRPELSGISSAKADFNE